MGLLDLFRSGIAGIDKSTPEGELLHRYMKSPGPTSWPPPKVETWDGGHEILAQSPESKARLVVMASKILAGDRQGFRSGMPLKSLLSRLLRSKLPFTEADLASLLDDLGTEGAWQWQLPAGLVVSAAERFLADRSLETAPALESALRRLEGKYRDWIPAAVYRRARLLLQGESETLADDAWGRKVRSSLDEMGPQAKAAWRSLMQHATAVTGKTRPSVTWQKKARPLVEVIGEQAVRESLAEWITDLVPTPVDGDPSAMADANTELLRGLLWGAAPVADSRVASRVGRLVEVSFQKVRGYGPRSSRLGNGGIIALGLMPGHDGVAELTRLDSKVRYDTARRMIASTLERAAEAAGLSRIDLEELAVPHYGLDADGRLSMPVGDGVAEMEIDGDKVQLTWRLGEKRTKGAPKALREAEPDRVKEAKQLAKQLGTTLAGQASRIERHYLQDRSLDAADWRRRYLDHALVSTLTKRLFWVLEADGTKRTVWWQGDGLRDLSGEPVQDAPKGRMRLWHPVASSAEEVRRVRSLITDARITQPFKQAYREVYLLTDAERETATYSNRFAAHILRQHQFQALCQQRGWKYALQGQFDSHNTPHRALPAFDMGVEFWVEPAGDEATEMGIFNFLSSDQVCFIQGERRLELDEVPALAFSEALRDVDLFTSVSSVGNDPNWHDRGDQPEGWAEYWNDFAFGDLNATAETRREVLEGLLPLLNIADRCRLDDRWLVVRGDIRTYRIHLRSGHIMMEPNNQYLCIVPDRSTGRKKSKIYLPFEGDSVLTVILSKAFLLAEDTKIKDSSILSQIHS